MAIVHLNLTLKKYNQNEEFVQVRIQNETPLHAILGQIGLPEEEVGLVIRNGRWERTNCTVREEDELDLFPILSGG
jgi:sulfur carrier protein ThiS